MKLHSIRFKLFALLGTLILGFIMLSLVLNTLFLEKYYIRTKESALKESLNIIQEAYKGDIESIELDIEKIENQKGIHIVIMDDKLQSIYNPRNNFGRIPPEISNRIENRIQDHRVTENFKKFTENALIEKRQDKRLNAWFLDLYGKKQNNGSTIYILMSTSVAAMSDSAVIANKFFMITGAVMLLLGGILIFMISNRFTQPIVQINQIAKYMSVLDFSQKIKVSSKDELGELGESINFLSTQLEKSIMELKAANKQLQEDINQKDKVDKLRKEFISNISHELKTPIALILGYTEGLKVNINDEEKDYYCDVITDEAQRMSKLVFSLLDLSQLESGAVGIEKSDFYISELVDQCLERNYILFKDKGVEVTQSGEDDYVVNADYERIEQMVTNYLTNAINHVDEKKIIHINYIKLENKIRVCVFNSGKHIPKESLDKIWDSFYKVDKARTRAYGGTGIGLYIVKTIMEAHSNHYGVQNVDNGVEFWFELDLSSSHIEQP